MSSIYRIQQDYIHLIELLEETEGEITEDIEKELLDLNTQRDDFLSSMLLDIVNENGNINTINEEIGRLKERIDAKKRHVDSVKKAFIKLLVFFDLKNSTKGSTNYVFKSPLISAFTKKVESTEVDDIQFAEKFKPITGERSEFVKYSVTAVVDDEILKKLNALGVLPITAFSPTYSKTEVKEYIKNLNKGSQLTLDDNNEIVIDPIASISKVVSKDSLVIK